MAPYYRRPRVSAQEVVLIKDEDYEETVVKEVRGVDEGSVDSGSHTTGYWIRSMASVGLWTER